MNAEPQQGRWRYWWVVHTVLITGIVIVAFLNLRMRTQRPASVPLPDYGALPSFTLTERSGKPLALADLMGKIWIADFIFTHCAGPCPLMTTRMAKLEQSLKAMPDVRLVSFTVDPARDTPPVLSKYADDYGASRERWFFLTGQQAAIYSLATNGFHLAVIENADGTSQPDHSTRFVLVDRRAQVRGYYDGTTEEGIEKLLGDVSKVVREKF